MIVEEFTDVEDAVITYLISRMAEMPVEYQDTTVGLQLPTSWKAATSPAHLSVACDAVEESQAWSRPGALRQVCAVRITAWADYPRRVKELGRLAHAALMAYPARPLVGVIATQDEDNRAPICTFTIQIDQRPIS